MWKWYGSCVILRLEKEKELESWQTLHVGGIDGISCQHLQIMMTILKQKTWEWQEDRTPMLRHGSVVCPTKYLASMNIKTDFDDARPSDVAKIWKVMALMDGLSQPSCAQDKKNRPCSSVSMSPPKKRRSSLICGKRWPQLLANVEENWTRKRIGIFVGLVWQKTHQRCNFMWADNFWIMSHSKCHLEQMLWDLYDSGICIVGFGTEASKLVVDKYL